MEEKIKTIAIFMGLLQDEKGFWGFKNTPERQRCHSDRIKDIYQYDRDWNLLMEVVEKIFKDFYKLNPCPIYLKMNIEKALNEVNIDVTYNSCVEFIKWYNQNKEKAN